MSGNDKVTRDAQFAGNMTPSESLALLRVWKGDKYVPFTTLSDEDQQRVRDWVNKVWTEATLKHIESLKRRYGIVGGEKDA